MSARISLEELLLLPGGLGPEAVPDDARPWFSTEETLWLALRRARPGPEPVASSLEADAAGAAAGIGSSSDAASEAPDALLASLSDTMLAALVGLRDSGDPLARVPHEPSPDDAVVPGLSTLVRQLGAAGVEAPAGGLEAWLAPTRAMLWALRLGVLLPPGSVVQRERRMRFAFEAVERWLGELLGARAERLHDPDRMIVVPQTGLALLNLVERGAALETRLVAAALVGRAGLAEVGEVRAAIGEALLDGVPARRDLAASLGVGRVASVLALMRAGELDERAAREALRDAGDARAPSLLEALFGHLAAAGRGDEALELVLAHGALPGVSSQVLRGALRLAMSPPLRAELGRVLAAHGCASLDAAEGWLAERTALERARAALSSARPADALRELRRARAEPEALVLQARAHAALGQHERALGRYEQAAALAPGDASLMAALGRTAAAAGRGDATQLLELAFQMGHEGGRDAELLAELAIARGELLAAERWLAVADERGRSAGSAALHEGLARASMAEARALSSRGEHGQADGLLELAARHAPSLAGRVGLERFAVRERWLGRSEALSFVVEGSPDSAEAVARAATEAVTEGGREGLAPGVMLELGESLESAHRRAVWPLALVAAAQRAAGDEDGALAAAEAGLSRCSGQIAAEVPGGAAVPLSGRLAGQREDACALYATMVAVHRSREDFGGAAQAVARGLAHLGLVEPLVRLAGVLLAESEGGRVQVWELTMASLLGPEGVTALVEALRSRVEGEAPAAASAAEARVGAGAELLAAVGAHGLVVPAPVEGLLAEAGHGALSPDALVERVAWMVAQRGEGAGAGAGSGSMSIALAGQGGGVVGEAPVASAPSPVAGWGVHRIEKASDALSGSSGTVGAGAGGPKRGGSSS